MTTPGMTGASWALLGAAGAVAAADWVAVATRRARVEYVCKPLVVTLLAACAVVLDPVDGLRRAYVITGLTLSLAGDIFLMVPEPPPPSPQESPLPRARQPQRIDLFPLGLAAFLLAHLNYIAAFRTGGRGLAQVALASLIVLPVAVPLGSMIVRALVARRLNTLRVPVIAYIAVLGAMVAAAVATGNLLAAGGAWLFLASDGILAWDRFVKPIRWAPVLVVVTYHLAQGLITVSLLR